MAFTHGVVPEDGVKRGTATVPSTINAAKTYLLQPTVAHGARLRGTVTIVPEARISYSGSVLSAAQLATLRYRLLVDGEPQPGFTIDTTAWPDGTHVLAVQCINPGLFDVGNGSKVVVFNNSGSPITRTEQMAVVGGKYLSNVFNSIAWGRVDVSWPPKGANLGHNHGNHPDATTDADRAALATKPLWWVDHLTAPGTGLYFTTPILVKNADGDYFVYQFYPATFNSSLHASHVVGTHPAYDGPRNVGSLTGYATCIRGLKTLASGHTGWLGVAIDGRVVDLDVSGEVTTIFGPRSVAGVVGRVPTTGAVLAANIEFTLAQRLAAGEKEFVGDPRGALNAPQDLWAREAAPDTIWIADTGNDRIAILDRAQQAITAMIPLPKVSSVWGGEDGVWWAVTPLGLYRIESRVPSLVAPIPNAFWLRGDRNGKVYVMTTRLAFYEYDIASATAVLGRGPVSTSPQEFSFFDIDVNGVIGPTNRIYFGGVNLGPPDVPGGSNNATWAWLDPGVWTPNLFRTDASRILNYKIYGSFMATSNPLGHYPWGFAIHKSIAKFIAAGISAGWKSWTAHLGPQPVPDAAIPNTGVVPFRTGQLDTYLGLGAIYGSLGHGEIGYHVDDFKDLRAFPEAEPVMRATLEPLFASAMTETQKRAVTQTMWAQRTRPHFQASGHAFTWTYTPGSIEATGLRLKIGPSAGVYTISKDLPPTSGTVAVSSVVTTPGAYFATVVAFNDAGEGVGSPEVAFSLGAAPTGNVTMAVA